MTTSQTTRQARAILWLAMLAMVLVSAFSNVRIDACVGDCCHEIAATCCETAAEPTAEESCCCCTSVERSEDDDDEGARGRCEPGCCITILFEIDVAPATECEVEAPSVDLSVGEIAFAPFEAPPRQIVRVRPFDRGPPRIDRTTALRAQTVLLI